MSRKVFFHGISLNCFRKSFTLEWVQNLNGSVSALSSNVNPYYLSYIWFSSNKFSQISPLLFNYHPDYTENNCAYKSFSSLYLADDSNGEHFASKPMKYLFLVFSSLHSGGI